MPALNIAHLRLQNQHLAAPKFTRPADIVRWLGAVQAQDYTGAKWALGQRLQGCSDMIVEQAFTDGDILRTHVMRPTWHFVTREDIRWMVELTSARVQAIASTQHRQFKLDSAVFAQCEKAIHRALEGGKQLMRDELATALQQAGIATNEQRFIHIMMQMELIGLLCSGGRIGKQFTYALLDDRAPGTNTLTRDEALITLAERYFTAHGPATLQDFVWWSGLTVAEAKAGLNAIKHKLLNEELNGNTYWFTEPAGEANSRSAKAYLLPNYDEYIVSYKDRSASIREKDISKADPRGTIFNHTFIINGKIEGMWKRELKKDLLAIELIPFKPLSKAAIAAITTTVKRHAKFLGMKDYTLKL